MGGMGKTRLNGLFGSLTFGRKPGKFPRKTAESGTDNAVAVYPGIQ